MKGRMNVRIAAAVLAGAALLGLNSTGLAHCDTPEGPVVPAVKTALDSGDLTPAMRWIKPEYEKQITEAYQKAQEARKAGGAARELADTWFVETFVRLHRAGEGEPFTGVKPAGTDPGEAVKAADAALKSGDGEALVKVLQDAVGRAVHERFERASKAREHADHNVEAGREYVDAYVSLVHFAEQIQKMTAENAHGAHHGH